VLSIIERFKEERKYVKKRLQFMADAAFPGRNPKIKIFGSIKTGLALETSDMDIAVTGLSIDSREQMIDYLNAMAD
jgi:DNA polymerase sigma